jgi:phosphohistidine phosphatase SixA
VGEERDEIAGQFLASQLVEPHRVFVAGPPRARILAGALARHVGQGTHRSDTQGDEDPVVHRVGE